MPTKKLTTRMMPAVVVYLAASLALDAATIQDIVIQSAVPGTPVTKEDVANFLASASGAEFDQKLLDADIKRLMDSGMFLDAQAAVIPVTSDKLQIIFTIKPGPLVREVIFTGNALVETKSLKGEVLQQAKHFLNSRTVDKDVAALRQLYMKKGYHGTQVKAEVVPVADSNEVVVTYQIVENPRHKLRQIRFTGNTHIPADQLRKKVLTKPSIWRWVFPTGYMNPDLLTMDVDAVVEAYQDQGYFDVQVPPPAREISDNGKWVTLVFNVTEGAQYTVSGVGLSGNTLFTRDELLACDPKKGQTALEVGKPFNGDTMRAMMDRIRGKYDPKGYIDLRLVPRKSFDSAAHTVQIDFEIVEGKPCTIRDIAIVGNVVTKPHVIRRELSVLPEDVANARRLKESQSRLMNLNYFETVDVVPQATDREDQKDVAVLVKEKSTGMFTVGAGFSTDDGLFGTASLTQSNFDLFDPPTFTGGGQKAKIQTEVGTEFTNVDLGLTEPWFMDQRLQLDTNLYSRTRSWDYYDQETLGTSLMLTRPLWPSAPENTEWQFWRNSLGIRLDSVRLTDFDDEDHVDQFLLDEEGDYTVPALVYRISRDTRDRFLHPRTGSHLQLSTEYTPDAIGYADVFTADARASKYIPVGRWTLRLDGQAASVWGDPALFDRLYAGGAKSMRGFKLRSVGPADSHDNYYGGQTLGSGTVEMTYPFSDIIFGSVFTDFGNVWEEETSWDGDISASVGVGLQVDLPFGPLRMDYAIPYATSYDHQSTSGRFDISLGYTF